MVIQVICTFRVNRTIDYLDDSVSFPVRITLHVLIDISDI